MKVFKLDPKAKLPTRTHPTDAGADLYSLESVWLPLGSTVKIKTGVAIEVPIGSVGKIEGRSSMNAKGIMASGGVVDASYSGEVSVILNNFSNSTQWNEHSRGYYVEAGDKIAQLLTYKIDTPEVEEVFELWTSDRGNKGFGHSGR